jgi:hypothetical protein
MPDKQFSVKDFKPPVVCDDSKSNPFIVYFLDNVKKTRK